MLPRLPSIFVAAPGTKAGANNSTNQIDGHNACPEQIQLAGVALRVVLVEENVCAPRLNHFRWRIEHSEEVSHRHSGAHRGCQADEQQYPRPAVASIVNVLQMSGKADEII